MKILFIGAYNKSEITISTIKVAKQVFQSLKSKVNALGYLTYFDDGKKYNRYQKLFGKETIDQNIYRFGIFPLILYIIRYKPDIIQIVTPDAFYLPLFILKPFLGFKIIYLSHIIISYKLRHFKKLEFLNKIRFLFIEKVTSRFSDMLFVLSKSESRYLRRYLHCDLKKLKIIDNGMNCLEYKKIYAEEYDNDIIKIIFIGSVVRKEKGFNFLLEGLKLLPYKVQLTICDTKNQSDNDKNIPGNINLIFPDPLNEIELRKEIIKNDLIIVPSLYESFSLALLEAMNTGILFISTNKVGLVGRFPEAFSQFIIPLKNHRNLADKILYFFNLPQDRKQLLSKSIREFTKDYSWEVVSLKYLSFYKELVENQ